MARRKYEYKLLKDIDPSQITETNLNNYGQEGWELVYFQLYNGKFYAIFIRE